MTTALRLGETEAKPNNKLIRTYILQDYNLSKTFFLII